MDLAARSSSFFLQVQQQIFKKPLLTYLERYGGYRGQREAWLSMWILAHAMDAAASNDFSATFLPWFLCSWPRPTFPISRSSRCFRHAEQSGWQPQGADCRGRKPEPKETKGPEVSQEAQGHSRCLKMASPCMSSCAQPFEEEVEPSATDHKLRRHRGDCKGVTYFSFACVFTTSQSEVFRKELPEENEPVPA